MVYSKGMKAIKLSQSEIDNAETSYGEHKQYTIIRRLQANGKYLVAAVNIDSREIITSELVDTKEDVQWAIYEVNRWMDKAYGGGPMSHKSPNRGNSNPKLSKSIMSKIHLRLKQNNSEQNVTNT